LPILRWTAKDVVTHSPVSGKPENIRNGLTPARLCHATITQSDNTAANVLLKQIGGPAGLTRYYRSLGDRFGRLDRWETELNDWKPGEKRDTITPASMARDLRKLTTGDALVPADRKRLVGWLRASETGKGRIAAGLPAGWKSGDKTGTGGLEDGRQYGRRRRVRDGDRHRDRRAAVGQAGHHRRVRARQDRRRRGGRDGHRQDHLPAPARARQDLLIVRRPPRSGRSAPPP